MRKVERATKVNLKKLMQKQPLNDLPAYEYNPLKNHEDMNCIEQQYLIKLVEGMSGSAEMNEE